MYVATRYWFNVGLLKIFRKSTRSAFNLSQFLH